MESKPRTRLVEVLCACCFRTRMVRMSEYVKEHAIIAQAKAQMTMTAFARTHTREGELVLTKHIKSPQARAHAIYGRVMASSSSSNSTTLLARHPTKGPRSDTSVQSFTKLRRPLREKDVWSGGKNLRGLGSCRQDGRRAQWEPTNPEKPMGTGEAGGGLLLIPTRSP